MELVAFLFRLAVSVLQHRSGFFFVLAVADLARIESRAAVGAGSVIAHSCPTLFTSSGMAPRHWTAQRPS